MLTTVEKTNKREKEEEKERRKMSIIDIAKKSGVILGNGEYWNGRDRRAPGESIPRRDKGEKEERKKEEKDERRPANFFG